MPDTRRAEVTTVAGGTAAPNERPRVPAIRWVYPVRDGAVTRLGTETITLGRSAECTVQLSGGELSRVHAEVRREGPLHVVVDRGSRNGLFVDGQRVEGAPVAVGTVLRIGEWVGVGIECDPDEPDAAAFGELAPGLLGGPGLRRHLALLRRAAASDLPIVLVGETGTGKECVARALHAWSGRPGSFVGLNCAAITESLAEAELFGHEKGAFTGATVARPGHLRTAEAGTLLLDEIVDLPAGVQAKLLRAMEQREVLPLGRSVPVPVNVRLVAATQLPLAAAVEDGSFRADLCARLEGLVVELPPLRERRDEIPFLFFELLRRHGGGQVPAVEGQLVERLCLHDWPHNVRELDLLARRLLVLHGHEGPLRTAHFLGDERREARVVAPASPEAAREPLAAPSGETAQARRQREYASLVEALRVSHGNVARAASLAGLSRQRAYRLLQDGSPDELEKLRLGRDREE